MFDIIRSRLTQGYRTMKYPHGPAPELPEQFVGKPEIQINKCKNNCEFKCINVCPTGALNTININNEKKISLDMGKCLFCKACQNSCSHHAINFSRDYKLSTFTREGLVIKENDIPKSCTSNEKIKKMFGRSLKLRQVSAGGCNACEADTNVLNTLAWDLDRFGIQFVASPRHADGLFITGPVTQNMKKALLKTYEAVASPKIVIAAGACAISGGPYIGHKEVCDGVTDILPVDLFIPGCPPHPLTILDELLGFLDLI